MFAFYVKLALVIWHIVSHLARMSAKERVLMSECHAAFWRELRTLLLDNRARGLVRHTQRLSRNVQPLQVLQVSL